MRRISGSFGIWGFAELLEVFGILVEEGWDCVDDFLKILRL